MSAKKPCYIWDPSLINQCDRLQAVPDRASLVHNLITAYGINNHLQVVRSIPATYDDLKKFHSELYLDHLKCLKEIEEDYIASSQDEEYGIVYDCPPISNIYELVSNIAGGSITAAKCLLLGISNIAINWCGGWHHAHRSRAEGFCYVNDIVLAIEKLREKFQKVLYIDLDVHHGNGVEDAYKLCDSVFTLSFHKYEPGFYPGSGGIDDGNVMGKTNICNFPLNAFYSDKSLDLAFGKVFPEIFSKFLPDAIVMQCGADALVGDPHGGACLTEQGYIMCLQKVLAENKPVILLGGGGYNHPNAAKLWVTLTSVAAGIKLDENIPEHDDWLQYGPHYLLSIQPSLTKDLNTDDYLNKCVKKIKYNLESTNDEKNCHLPTKRRKDNINSFTVNSKESIKADNTQILRNKSLNIENRLKICKEQSEHMNDKIVCDVYEFLG
ncbi:histone deacetylase 8-like [Battus philenor]|uniref:histone deacetylase 8-like n=1 Tax=Battus philenor TaxID=42288 RepID=UPI0035D08B50